MGFVHISQELCKCSLFYFLIISFYLLLIKILKPEGLTFEHFSSPLSTLKNNK